VHVVHDDILLEVATVPELQSKQSIVPNPEEYVPGEHE